MHANEHPRHLCSVAASDRMKKMRAASPMRNPDPIASQRHGPNTYMRLFRTRMRNAHGTHA